VVTVVLGLTAVRIGKEQFNAEIDYFFRICIHGYKER
jgi:hypothetical protein